MVTVSHYLVIYIILACILLLFNVVKPFAVVYLIHYSSVICASDSIVERLLATVVEDICVIHHGCYEISIRLFDDPCEFLRRHIGGFCIVHSDIGAEHDFNALFACAHLIVHIFNMVMFVIVQIIRAIVGLYGDGNGRYLFMTVVGEFIIALRNRKLAYDDLAVVEELAFATYILVIKGLYKGICIRLIYNYDLIKIRADYASRAHGDDRICISVFVNSAVHVYGVVKVSVYMKCSLAVTEGDGGYAIIKVD